MILVDTPVWSLALRGKAADLAPAERHLTQLLYQMVDEGRVELVGSVRQELLSGLREEARSEGFVTSFEIFPILQWQLWTTRKPCAPRINAAAQASPPL